jgi:hypothetical protein
MLVGSNRMFSECELRPTGLVNTNIALSINQRLHAAGEAKGREPGIPTSNTSLCLPQPSAHHGPRDEATMRAHCLQLLMPSPCSSQTSFSLSHKGLQA